MAGFDQSVAGVLGLDFIDVNMKDLDSYLPFRELLLQQHPKKREFSLPTYFLVSELEGNACVHAEIIGAMQEDAFRERLSALIRKTLIDCDQLAGSKQDD
jgi:hypothetical protein